MGKRPTKRRGGWKLADVPAEVPPRERWPADWQDHGLRLCEVFNACLTRTQAHREALAVGGRAAYVKVPTLAAREVFYALHAWCTERQLVPAAWIHLCFATGGWAQPPSLKRLFSKGMIPRYHEWQDANLDVVTDLALAREEAHARKFVPFVDLHWGAELAKWNMLSRGRHELCIVSDDVTFGYHPQSKVCASCPVKRACEARTGALRQAAS